MKTAVLVSLIWTVQGFSIYGAIQFFDLGGFWGNFGGVSLSLLAFTMFLGTLVLVHELFRRKPKRTSELFSDPQ